jgi:transcriptional regulator with PAS, ATPase and Fis domain
VQAKLLRVLEDKTFRRIGENKTTKVDIRILAATNRTLAEAVSTREFREDLYYRLNVVSVHMPPLRARRSDIPLLAEHFLRKYAERDEKQIQGIAQEAMRFLLVYSWPGNVRELSHVIEQAVAVSRTNLITADVLPPQLREAAKGALEESVAEVPGGKGRLKGLEEKERELIREALERNEGSLSKTASELGVSRVTLWRRMKRYGLQK